MRPLARFALAVAAALVPALVGAQQVGPVMPAAPASIDAEPPPSAPSAIRQEDAARLYRDLAPRNEKPAPPAPPSSRTIEIPLESRAPENGTPRFLFRDVTDRTSPRVKPLPERAAAVEALRRSLAPAAGGPAK